MAGAAAQGIVPCPADSHASPKGRIKPSIEGIAANLQESIDVLRDEHKRVFVLGSAKTVTQTQLVSAGKVSAKVQLAIAHLSSAIDELHRFGGRA